MWFVLTIGLFVLSEAMGGIKTDDPNRNPNQASTESAKASVVFDDAGSTPPYEDVTLVITSPSLHATDPAFQAFVAQTVMTLKGVTATQGGQSVPGFASVTDPATTPPSAGRVAPDGSAVEIVARIDGDQDVVNQHLIAIRPAITGIEAGAGQFTVHAVSQTITGDDITDLINSSLDRTFATIGLTFIILLITFGALVAAVVPLVLAISALLAGFGILGIFSQTVFGVSPYATQLIVLIGLAVSVDYSLFMITRFRSERALGRDKLDAIEIASSTAGRAVFFSGLAVMISIAGLFLIDVSIFRSMAIGTIGVILVAIVGSLTFLPATLAILGDRINRGRVPFVARNRPEGSGFWAGIVARVMRRPLVLAAVAVVVLLGLANPMLHLHIGVTDITAFPDQIDGVQAIKILDEKWPQGTTLAMDVTVTGFDRADTKAAVAKFEQAALAVPGLSGPATVTPSGDGKVALVAFTQAGTQNDPASQAVVRQIRSTVIPARFGGLSGVQVYVGGDVASALDTTQIYLDAIPLVVGFVLTLSFLLLLIVFHSLVIPIKAIILNLLSTAAAFGVVVAVFQDGILGGSLGIERSPVIEAGCRSSSSPSCSGSRWTTTSSSCRG